MLKKIVSLKYTDKRDIFHHPETMEEFQRLLKQMTKFNEIGDCHGVFITAMQLIPTVIETLDYQDDSPLNRLSEEEHFYIKVSKFLEDNKERAYTPEEMGKVFNVAAIDLWKPLTTLISKRLVSRDGKYYRWVEGDVFLTECNKRG